MNSVLGSVYCVLFITIFLSATTLAEVPEDSNEIAPATTEEPVLVSSLQKCDTEYPRMNPDVPLYFEQVSLLSGLK